MTPPTNPSIAPLVELVDKAMALESTESRVDAIKTELCKLIRSGNLEIPAEVHRGLPDRYARRLIHRDLARGYSIVAMTWGPGQSTAIHDHSGMWCVEGVWAGSINVQQFELVDQKPHEGRFRFAARNSYEAGRGSAGCLIPPYEYHLIENPCDESLAVSIHIYGGEMLSCNCFEPAADGWYQQVERSLSYDNAA